MRKFHHRRKMNIQQIFGMCVKNHLANFSWMIFQLLFIHIQIDYRITSFLSLFHCFSHSMKIGSKGETCLFILSGVVFLFYKVCFFVVVTKSLSRNRYKNKKSSYFMALTNHIKRLIYNLVPFSNTTNIFTLLSIAKQSNNNKKIDNKNREEEQKQCPCVL